MSTGGIEGTHFRLRAPSNLKQPPVLAKNHNSRKYGIGTGMILVPRDCCVAAAAGQRTEIPGEKGQRWKRTQSEKEKKRISPTQMNSDSIKTSAIIIIIIFYRTETSDVVDSVESFRPYLLVAICTAGLWLVGPK